jgi:hypothetical protein
MHCTGLCIIVIHIHIHRLTMRLRTLRSPIPKKTTLQGSRSHSSGMVLSSRNRHFGSWAAPGHLDTLEPGSRASPHRAMAGPLPHSTAQHSTAQSTHRPRGSKPRRPARPIICRNWRADRKR